VPEIGLPKNLKITSATVIDMTKAKALPATTVTGLFIVETI
jgi:hypothetical protein